MKFILTLTIALTLSCYVCAQSSGGAPTMSDLEKQLSKPAASKTKTTAKKTQKSPNKAKTVTKQSTKTTYKPTEDVAAATEEADPAETIVETPLPGINDLQINDGPVVDSNKAEIEKKQEEDKIYNMAFVEQKPSFPGGDSEIYKWLGANINYPAEAAKEGVSGKVTVQLVIDKDGSVTNVKVVRGKHPALDAEAVRVIKAMPNWIPGKVNGENVRVIYMLPVTFKLN